MIRKRCFLAHAAPHLWVIYADTEADAQAALDAAVADAEVEGPATMIPLPAPARRITDVGEELGMES